MAPNATNTLQANITSTDPNGNTSINRGLGNPTLGGIVAQEVQYQLLAAGDNTISLPSTPVFNIYIKNNAAPGGNTVTPKLTPNGGAQQVLAPMQPGGVFLWWMVVNSVAAAGYSAIVLNASGANTPVEYFLGA